MPPKPRRSYRSVIESLRQVWRIETLEDKDAIWTFGEPSLEAFDSKKRLRICIWNMCKGAGGQLFEHDFRVLMYGADIFLAQEALMSERSMRTFRQPGFQLIHGASYKRLDGLRDGVLTMSRAKMQIPAQRIICKYPEPLFKTPKAALAVMVHWQGFDKPILVVNIHATLVRSIKGAVDEISHLIEHLPAHDGPMILAGDFNTFTTGYLDAVKGRLGDIGLEMATIPEDPRRPIAALDQLFVRGIRVKQVIVETTIKNSDHFPLVADLEAG